MTTHDQAASLFRDALRRHVDEFCAPEGAYPTCTGAVASAADGLGCGAGASPLRAALPASPVSRGGGTGLPARHGTSSAGRAGAAPFLPSLPASHRGQRGAARRLRFVVLLAWLLVASWVGFCGAVLALCWDAVTGGMR